MREEKLNDYEAFVDKFKPKKTTDDCYTPPDVYEAVLEHVRTFYGIPDSAPIIRPFYTGGDYENAEYPDGCVVVDNPPFSILSKIVDFYRARGIRFFIFSPSLTSITTVKRREGITFVNVNVGIIYENGAVVNTGFLTNLSPDLIFQTFPSLRQKIKALQQARATNKKPKKIEYSDNIFGAKVSQAISSVEFSIRRDETMPFKDGEFFGGAFLISTKVKEKIKQALSECKRAREEAERARVIHVPLTPEQEEAIRILDHET